MALSSTLHTLYEHYTAGGITSGLSVDKPYFTLNDRNVSLYSGAMHYFRIPRQYWRDRLRKLRAAGLNTVETYVPWNLHEPEDGRFDFGDGGSDFEQLLDIQEFIKTAQEEDLFVIVRPGPYICSEFEWGGLPSWLLRDETIRVRTSESTFMTYVTRYFSMLLPLLTMLQFVNGGPIIAFQVENEYAYSPQRDLDYIRQLVDIMRENGVVELLVSSDGAWSGSAGTVPGLIFQTVNFGSDPIYSLDRLSEMQPNQPLMVMEFWSGWYDHWAEIHNTVSTSDFEDIFTTIIDYPASVNMYMFHGGTNWGFLNGANIGVFGNENYDPDTTSYDYDAPLSEAGDYTEKYDVVKELLARRNTLPIITPEQPELIPRIQYADVLMQQSLNLDDIISQTNIVRNKTPLPMEKLPINNGSGQSYGYIVYRKENIDLEANAVLTIKGYVFDTVIVLVNGQLISKPLAESSDLEGFGYWKIEDSSIVLTTIELKGATIDLVVENWGRGNFGYLYEQYKGLRDDVLVDGEIITDWVMAPLEFKKSWTTNLEGWRDANDLLPGPVLLRGILTVDGEPRDTFVDLQEWSKGLVIVNGFVLGKYARIGPQQTLYLPGPFLKPGANELVVFEHYLPLNKIQFSTDPIYKTL